MLLLFILLGSVFLTNADVYFLIFTEIKFTIKMVTLLLATKSHLLLIFFTASKIGPVTFSSNVISEDLHHIERLQIGFNIT
jgi:hypothetical protein